MSDLNTNIDRASPVSPTFIFAGIAAAFVAVSVAAAFVTLFRFSRRINSALNNGRRRLSLKLGQVSSHGFWLHCRRSNRHSGQRWNLHNTHLLKYLNNNFIITHFYQKYINLFLIIFGLFRSLILNAFDNPTLGPKGFFVCKHMRTL